jgi:putative heme transporter
VDVAPSRHVVIDVTLAWRGRVSRPRPRRMEDEALPAWYRTAAAASWRFLVIAAAIAVVVYALVHLRVVVLPIIVALPASTLLLALVRWLKDRNAPDALAAAVAMIAAALLVVAVATAVAPSVADQFDELRPQAEEGIREASDVLADPPFNVSDRELDQTVDEGIARLRENSGPLAYRAARCCSGRSSPA